MLAGRSAEQIVARTRTTLIDDDLDVRCDVTGRMQRILGQKGNADCSLQRALKSPSTGARRLGKAEHLGRGSDAAPNQLLGEVAVPGLPKLAQQLARPGPEGLLRGGARLLT
jgi:hypothetical protein